MPNSRMSTWRVILKPVAFAMHRGWYSIYHIIIGHGSEAMARYPGRAGLLHDAIFALWRSSWQASAGVIIIA